MAGFFDFLKGAAGGAAFLPGVMDSLTGKGARKDLDAAYGDSKGMLDAAYKDASAIGDRYYGEGRADLNPYAQQGLGANRLIADALGINGREAQAGYYQNFQTDPGFQGEVDAGVQALDRSATARGGLYSGAAMKGVQQFGHAKMGDAYRNRLAALTGQQGVGQQAAGGQAQLAGQFGGDQMNLRYGYGQQGATNRINYGNALADNRGTLMKNVLGVGGLAVRAYGVPGK